MIGPVKPWVALAALLTAPFGSAIVLIASLQLSALADGYRRSVYLTDAFLAAPIAILFFAVGGPLIAVFWKRAPFGSVPCGVFGAACGTLIFYLIGVGLSDADDYAYFEREGQLFEYYLGAAQVVIMGTLVGLAGGLTFWGICRLGSRSPE